MAETSIVDLERLWKERCEKGTFSAAILGLGTIQVMGKSGDTALQFPRIASLDVLSELEPDEQYAVQTAETIIRQAGEQNRTVYVLEHEKAPERITTFRPDVETILIVARVAGGLAV
jgi:hypothetical protein